MDNALTAEGEPSFPSNLPAVTEHQLPLLSAEPTEHTPLLSKKTRPVTPRKLPSLNSTGHDLYLDPHSLLAVPSTRSRGSSLDHHSISSYTGESLSTPATSEYGWTHSMSNEARSFHMPGPDHPSQLDLDGEREVYIRDNPFGFSPVQLYELLEGKNLGAFWSVGGLQGFELGLRTNCSSGLSLDETGLDGTVELDNLPPITRVASAGEWVSSLSGLLQNIESIPIRHTSSEPYVDRKRVFGVSRLPERKSKTFLQIMWVTFNDNVLIILTVVAAISLSLGLYQDFGQSSRYDGPKVRWVEGVTIIVAVTIVVIVGSVNDYQKENQFLKLSRKVNNPPRPSKRQH
jgi:Ca2+-transporting ATPase